MALGRQFENTYWHDDQGETHASLLNPHGFAEGKHKYEIEQTSGIAARAQARTVNAQGMLFSPETGTGRRNDPLIPHEKRIEAIQKGLGMSDLETYRKNAGVARTRNLTGKPLSKKTAEDSRNAYTHAVDTSQMSTHMINSEFANKQPALAVAVEDVRHAGHIDNTFPGASLEGVTSGRIDVIRQPLNYEKTYSKEPDTTRTVITGGDKTPINNPKFIQQLSKDLGDEQSHRMGLPINDALRAGAVVTTPEGRQWTQKDKPGTRSYSRYNTVGEIEKKIPKAPNMIGGNKQVNAQNIKAEDFVEKGYQINAFSGTGSDIKKKNPNVAVEPYAGVYGYGANRWSEKTWHTRSEVTGGTPVEKTVRGKTIVTKTNPSVSRSTIIHEMGHKMDNKHRFDIYDKGGADPVSEGIADAHRDLWGSADDNNKYSQRMFETGDVGDLHASSGYTTGHRRWTTNTERAVYSAVRAHASAVADPKVFRETPTRKQLVMRHSTADETRPTRDLANKLMLGHLYDAHEHVRNAIDSNPNKSLRTAGREARQFYQDRVNAKTASKSEQLQLPGFEV
jgi:hypothetical protein